MTTVPANEALAAWDGVHNAREELNGLIDSFPDIAMHEPNTFVPAETAKELQEAGALMRQAATLLDVASDREQDRPGNRDASRGINGSEKALTEQLDNLDFENLTPERAEKIVAAIDAASRVASATDSDGSQTYDNPYDELTLTFERAQTLVQAIIDAVMSGEDRDVVCLGALTQLQLDYAGRICSANNKYWHKIPGERP